MRFFQRSLPMFVLLLTIVAAPTVLLAKGGEGDRVHFFRSINVGPDEEVGDVVCIACSVRMAGTATGDVVAVFGSVSVDGSVDGDVVAVGGMVRLAEDAIVKGDTVGVGGGVSRHPNASVKGSVVSEAGPGILLGLILGTVVVPLLPIVLIIWLIVWLVRRDRPVSSAPMPYRR